MDEEIISDVVEASTKEISGVFSDYLSLMRGKPRVRFHYLKTSLIFPCRGLNHILDSINLRPQ